MPRRRFRSRRNQAQAERGLRSPESTGFEWARLRGVCARYAAHVHDERVNRLACVAQYTEYHAQDIRLPLAELTSNPFKR